MALKKVADYICVRAASHEWLITCFVFPFIITVSSVEEVDLTHFDEPPNHFPTTTTRKLWTPWEKPRPILSCDVCLPSFLWSTPVILVVFKRQSTDRKPLKCRWDHFFHNITRHKGNWKKWEREMHVCIQIRHLSRRFLSFKFSLGVSHPGYNITCACSVAYWLCGVTINPTWIKTHNEARFHLLKHQVQLLLSEIERSFLSQNVFFFSLCWFTFSSARSLFGILSTFDTTFYCKLNWVGNMDISRRV